MSRKHVFDPDKNELHERVESYDECKYLIEGVCCNEYCDQLQEYVDHRYCKKCRHFTREDGKE